MMLSTKSFQIINHAKSPITIPAAGGGGGTTTVRLNPSWIISKSLLEELSVTAPSAPSGHPQVSSPCLILPALKDKSTGDIVFRFFNHIDKNIIKINKKNTDSSPLPNTARCFGSSHGWLAFIDPSDCGLYLWDPFSADSVIRLPSVETLPRVVGTIRNDDRSIKKFIMQKFYRCDDYERFTPRHMSVDIIEKVAFSSAFDNNNNNDCLLMAIEGMSKELVFCKPGDTAWTALDGPLGYQHIIPSSIKDKVFYAMGYSGKVEAWDFRDLSCIKRTLIDDKRCLCTPKFCELEAYIRARCWVKKIYLVESSGDLLLVYRYVADKGVAEDGTILSQYGKLTHNIPHKTLRFDVYKMDFSLGKWTYVNSLGDRALFVGLSNSFCLHVCNSTGLKPNSIYFSDDCWRTGNKGYRYGGHDMGVYNLEDYSIEPFYPFGHLRKITPTPFWVTLNPHSGNVAE